MRSYAALGVLSVLIFAAIFVFARARSQGEAWADMRPKTALALSPAAVEMARQWRLESEPTLGEQEAGRMLHQLYFGDVSADSLASLGFMPVEHDLAEDEAPKLDLGDVGRAAGHPHAGAMMKDVRSKTGDWESVAERAHRQAHASDGSDTFVRLARAGAVDIVGTRFSLPFAARSNVIELPMPKLVRIRDQAYARQGRAALLIADGRTDEAAEVGREVLSVGLLLYENSPFIVEALLGSVLVQHGLTIIENAHRASGNEEEAERVTLALTTRGEYRPEPHFGKIQSYAADRTIPPAFKWEHLMIEHLVRACSAWPIFPSSPLPYGEVENLLVRHDSERHLYRLLTETPPLPRSVLDWPSASRYCFG